MARIAFLASHKHEKTRQNTTIMLACFGKPPMLAISVPLPSWRMGRRGRVIIAKMAFPALRESHEPLNLGMTIPVRLCRARRNRPHGLGDRVRLVVRGRRAPGAFRAHSRRLYRRRPPSQRGGVALREGAQFRGREPLVPRRRLSCEPAQDPRLQPPRCRLERAFALRIHVAHQRELHYRPEGRA